MLTNIAIGCCLVTLTTFLHAAAMVAVLQRFKHAPSTRWTREAGFGFTKAAIVTAVVLAMFLASLVEAGLWAATYLYVGAIAEIEEALYFSTVTYTTLGFGDVVLPQEWRLLSSLQAANGILMFGWTTAIISWTVQRIYNSTPQLGNMPGRQASDPDGPGGNRDV